ELRFNGTLHDLTVEVYVAFDSELFGGHVLALSPATFSGALTASAQWLGILPELGALIGQQVAARSHGALALVGHYLAVALSRMVHKDATFVSIRADASAWYVDVAWPMPM